MDDTHTLPATGFIGSLEDLDQVASQLARMAKRSMRAGDASIKMLFQQRAGKQHEADKAHAAHVEKLAAMERTYQDAVQRETLAHAAFLRSAEAEIAAIDASVAQLLGSVAPALPPLRLEGKTAAPARKRRFFGIL